MNHEADGESDAGRALRLAEQLLELLDAVPGIPADIAAHLDLAIHRLREHIGTLTKSTRPEPGKDFH